MLNLDKPNDWAISLDLKDAYLPVPIYKSHRKYLRFFIQGKVYQFVALCLGPMQNPRCFTKIISVVTAHLRMQNVRLASYLDDWLRSKCNQTDTSSRSRAIVESSTYTRIHNKLGEVYLNSQSDSNVLRSSIQFSNRNSASYSRKGTKVIFSSPQINEQPQFCSRLFTHTGFNGLLYRISTQCQTIYETHTATPPSFLETNNR